MPSSDIATDDSIRKAPVETSKEIPRRYDLDGIDDEGADDSYHGQFTRNDRRDMGRMGKVQELRVRWVDGYRRCRDSAKRPLEEFSLILRIEFYRRPPGYLGGTFGASSPSRG